MKFFKRRSSRGDTIVEVLIGTALLGAAIGLGIITSNHNLRVSVDSATRNQANTVAQTQIEYLRNAYTTSSTKLDVYKAVGQPFCVLDGGGVANVADTNTKCNSFNGSQLNVSNSFSGSVFTINVSWASNANGSGQSQLTFYYKLPGNLTVPSKPSGLTSSSQTTSSISLLWNAPSPATGIVSYNIYRSGGTSGSTPVKVANVTAVSFNDTGLKDGTSYTYYVKAVDNFGVESDPSNSLVVSTQPLPIPTVNLTASSSSIGLCFSSSGNPGTCGAGNTCISVNEPSEPASHAWSDNYLCWPTARNLGLTWVTNGPVNGGIVAIGGQSCINTFEGSDSSSFWDDYICWPAVAGAHNFRWSSNGVMSNAVCTRWYEPSDPDSWSDNYLCEPNNSMTTLTWSSTNSARCDDSWGSPGGGTNIGLSGSDTKSVNYTTTFSVWCTDSSGQIARSSQAVTSGTPPVMLCSGATYCNGTPAPGVTTSAASSITGTSATLNGTVNPNGLSTSCSYDWGTSSLSNNTACSTSPGSGSSNVSVPINLSGLNYYTTYQFRLKATSSSGTTYGSTLTFTTSPAPPPLAWLQRGDNWQVVGPYGPGGYNWVESANPFFPNDDLGGVILQNTIVGLHSCIYYHYCEGQPDDCYNLSSYANAQVNVWTGGIWGTSSFSVNAPCSAY